MTALRREPTHVTKPNPRVVPLQTPTALLTTALIKMYTIAPKKETPKLSGLLRSNHRSPACTRHNGRQHRAYTKKEVANRPN